MAAGVKCENMFKRLNKQFNVILMLFVSLFRKACETLDELCEPNKNIHIIAGMWYVPWPVEPSKRSLGLLHILTHSSISVCGVYACCFSGEHWSSIMTFVGKKNKKALSTMDSLVLCHTCYQVYTTQEQKMNMPASRVILLPFFPPPFLTRYIRFCHWIRAKTHYTQMIYKQINFSCSRMVSQNYSCSPEKQARN